MVVVYKWNNQGRHGIQHNNIQHNDTQHKVLICDTAWMTHSINYSQQNRTVIMVSVVMLSVMFFCNSECHNVECCGAQPRGNLFSYRCLLLWLISQKCHFSISNLNFLSLCCYWKTIHFSIYRVTVLNKMANTYKLNAFN